MPRPQRVKEPSPVQVIVGNQQRPEPIEQKPPQEREEKPPNWFWDLLQSKPQEDWKAGAYQVWITRLADSRVPMAAGEKGYLDMFIEPITPAIVKQKYGGGKYQAVLNHRGRAETSHNFEIEGQPIYDTRRERPGNSSAVQAVQAASTDSSNLATQFISILREEMNHLREANQTPTGANEATVEILSNAAKKAAEIMERQTPQAGNPATMMKEMVEAMKSMGVIGGAQHGSTLGSLVQELTPLITLLSPFLEKLFKPADPLGQITMYVELFGKLDELRGKGGSGHSHGTTTNDLILEGIKTLPQVISDMNANKAALQRQPQRQIPPPAAAVTPTAANPRSMFPQSAPQRAWHSRPRRRADQQRPVAHRSIERCADASRVRRVVTAARTAGKAHARRIQRLG